MTRIPATALAALALLVACDDPVPSGPPPTGAQQALFAEYPPNLFAEAAIACVQSGGDSRMQGNDDLICEFPPDPQMAAALILEFDGTVEDLPSLVTRIYGARATGGYLVTVDNYIDLPGRDGRTRQLRIPSDRLGTSMRAMLERAGGQPL